MDCVQEIYNQSWKPYKFYTENNKPVNQTSVLFAKSWPECKTSSGLQVFSNIDFCVLNIESESEWALLI